MSGQISRRLLLAALSLFAVACVEAPAAEESSGVLSARVAAPVGPLAEAGFHRLTVGTSTVLYVPKSARAGAPFLLLFHGAGGRGDTVIRRFKDEADRRGIVLLAPDSADETWDVAVSMRSNRNAPPRFGKDVARIDAALTQAFAQVSVDPARVAVAGFSDGASYALSIGVRNSVLFPATMAFSAGGMVQGWTGPPGRVFISHGAKDRVLPIAIARDQLAPGLRGAGFKVEFVMFDGGHDLPDDVLAKAMAWWLG